MSDALKVLDEIEGRVKAATPGPWRWTDHGLVGPNTEFPGGRYIIAVTELDGAPVSNDWRYAVVEPANGPLIAHAPADLALLARACRELLAWGERVVDHCERMNFNTREEEWIGEELQQIRRELAKAGER